LSYSLLGKTLEILREINLSTWLRLELTVLEELADWS